MTDQTTVGLATAPPRVKAGVKKRWPKAFLAIGLIILAIGVLGHLKFNSSWTLIALLAGIAISALGLGLTLPLEDKCDFPL